MAVIRSRRSKLPAPPRAVFEDLCDPQRQPVRPWLHLLEGEAAPQIVDRDIPDRVVWSSLWRSRPDVRIQFDLAADGHGGTNLHWVMTADEPLPDLAVARAMGSRVDRLVNANLRHTYGQ